MIDMRVCTYFYHDNIVQLLLHRVCLSTTWPEKDRFRARLVCVVLNSFLLFTCLGLAHKDSRVQHKILPSVYRQKATVQHYCQPNVLHLFAFAQEIPYSRIDGSTSAKTRQKLCKEFNSEDEKKAFLISVCDMMYVARRVKSLLQPSFCYTYFHPAYIYLSSMSLCQPA